MQRHPKLDPGVRRTLERRIRAWRAEHGPEQEVIFRQTHEPGHRGFSDFTHMGSLGVSVAGQPLDHMLYHFRLALVGLRPCPGGARRRELHGTGGGAAGRALASRRRAPRAPNRQPVGGLLQPAQGRSRDMTERYKALCAHYGMTVSRNNRGRGSRERID